MTKVEIKPHLSLEGELKLDDYIGDVEPDRKTTQALQAWVVCKQEQTKERVLQTLVKMFGLSLVGSFFLVLNAQINPNVDKNFTKDVVTTVIGCQAGLLGTAYGAYLVHSIAQKKKQ